MLENSYVHIKLLDSHAPRYSVRKKTPRGTPSYSHMPNKLPHQSQTTTEDEANV